MLETVVTFHFSGGKVYSLNKEAYYACAITALFNISYLARYVYIQALNPFLTPNRMEHDSCRPFTMNSLLQVTFSSLFCVNIAEQHRRRKRGARGPGPPQ